MPIYALGMAEPTQYRGRANPQRTKACRKIGKNEILSCWILLARCTSDY
jgi:hypothetical protein